MKENSFATGIITGVVSTLSVVSIVALILVYIFGDAIVAANLSTNSDTAKSISESEDAIVNKIETLAAYIDQYSLYDINDEDVIQGIYKGLIDGLGDKYAEYYTAEEFKKFSEDTSGNYCGIGAYISENEEEGEVYISSPMTGSPAEKAGLRVGDVIVKVDGKEAIGKGSDTVVSWIKGEEGTKVELTIYREGEDDFLVFEVERKQIEVPTVTHKVLEDNIGYISVSQFDTVTTEQFRTALKDLQKKSVKGIIIDLRNNPGGNLSTVVEMSEMILPKGKVIVTTKDKDNRNVESIASQYDDFLDTNIVLLINQYSASASEIFASVIKDYKLGTIVGTTTYGKGLVQTVIKLKDESAIKITTAKYFTPAGNYINEVGIKPDIEVKFDTKSFYEDKVDNQLNKAIEVMKEKIKK